MIRGVHHPWLHREHLKVPHTKPFETAIMNDNDDKFRIIGKFMRSGVYCSNKVIHITIKDAIEAKRRNEKKRGVLLRVYQCEKCKCWHITSQPTKGNNYRELI